MRGECGRTPAIALLAAVLFTAGPGARADDTPLTAVQVARIRTMAGAVAEQVAALSRPVRERIVRQYVLNEFAVLGGVPGADIGVLGPELQAQAEAIVAEVLGDQPAPTPPAPPTPPEPAPVHSPPTPAPEPEPEPAPVIEYVTVETVPLVYYYVTPSAYSPPTPWSYVTWPFASYVYAPASVVPSYYLVIP
jgi:hypothetical protein